MPLVRTPKANSAQSLTVTSTATALTVPVGARYCEVEVWGSIVRFWTDGSTPTATVGRRGLIGDTLPFSGARMTQVKFIAETGGTAVLAVEYFTDDLDVV